MLTMGDLDLIHLAFRRLVEVLVRCQTPSVASQLNIWSRSLVKAVKEEEMGDLDLIHLAFRRQVGVLVRCQTPLVASQVNIWSRTLVGSRQQGTN